MRESTSLISRGRTPAPLSGICLLTGIWLLTGVGLGAVAGCRRPNEFRPPPPPPVTVAQPLKQAVTDYLEETGTTEAVEKVEIRARVTGFLEEVNFEPGAELKAGQVLYVIEQRPFQANVTAAQAELDAKRVQRDKAEIELKREQQMFAENATSERSVVQAKAERDSALAAIEAAKAALDRAQLDLEYTEVTSPIDGRVGKTLVKVGNLVDGAKATHLTTVIQYDPIYANFNISERALLEIMERAPREGRTEVKKEEVKLQLRRANDRGFPFEGHLDYADLAVDQSTGTYMVRGIFPNPDLHIVPGLFVRVRIPRGVQEGALLVPEVALGSDQVGRYLLVVNSQNVVERRNVTLGAKHEDLVVVQQGLRADDWVIIAGVQRSRPGAAVNPTRTKLTAIQRDIETLEPAAGSPLEEQPAEGRVPEDEAAAVPKAST